MGGLPRSRPRWFVTSKWALGLLAPVTTEEHTPVQSTPGARPSPGTGQSLRGADAHGEWVSDVSVQTYVRDDEPVLVRTTATRRSVGAVEGQLAATPSRVVFATEGGVTDVATDAVTAIEFREAQYPLWNAVLGVVLSVVGGFLLAVAYTGAGVPVTTWLGSGSLLVGVATLALGLRDRAATLELYTPARSFEFAGDGDALSAFPAAIRDGREGTAGDADE